MTVEKDLHIKLPTRMNLKNNRAYLAEYTGMIRFTLENYDSNQMWKCIEQLKELLANSYHYSIKYFPSEPMCELILTTHMVHTKENTKSIHEDLDYLIQLISVNSSPFDILSK